MVITQRSVSPSSQPAPPPDTKKKKESNNNNEVSATICSNCGTTTTPLWRRAPNGETICNACGLYLKARNTLRPPSMKRNLKKQQQLAQQLKLESSSISAADAPAGTCPGGGQCNGTGGSASCEGCPAFNQHQVNRHALICANCRATTTPLWRRDEAGNTICNACGLYYKLHNVHRPVSMKRSVIKRRKRIIVSDNGELEEQDEDELDSSSADEPSNDDDDDDEEKVKAAEAENKKKRRVVLNHNRNKKPSPNRHPAVPAIEDYIIPKRTTLQQQQQQQQEPTMINSTPQQRLPPPPRTPPLNPTFHHPRTLPAIDINNNNNNRHSSSPPPPPPLPGKRFDPLFDYRSNSNSTHTTPTPAPATITTNNNKSVELPPIITPPPPALQQSNYNHHNPYQDLSEFDSAMTRLERLRRRVPPEQSKVLSRLTSSLEEIVAQAENILLNPSPQQQQQQQHHGSNGNSISHRLL